MTETENERRQGTMQELVTESQMKTYFEHANKVNNFLNTRGQQNNIRTKIDSNLHKELKEVLVSRKDEPPNRSCSGLILNSEERLLYLRNIKESQRIEMEIKKRKETFWVTVNRAIKSNNGDKVTSRRSNKRIRDWLQSDDNSTAVKEYFKKEIERKPSLEDTLHGYNDLDKAALYIFRQTNKPNAYLNHVLDQGFDLSVIARIQSLTVKTECKKWGMTFLDKNCEVKKVIVNSIGDIHDFRPKDILIKVNDQNVKTMTEAKEIIALARESKTPLLKFTFRKNLYS